MAMKPFKLSEKDGTPNLRSVVTRLRAVSDLDVRIGFIKGVKSERQAITDHTEQFKTNASIAHTHEFGAPSRGIPARPFLIPAWNANIDFVNRTLGHAITLDLAGRKNEVQRALSLIGQKVVADAKMNIREQVGFAPLNEKTLQMRRFEKFKGTKALIRTGQMLNAITYKVHDD